MSKGKAFEKLNTSEKSSWGGVREGAGRKPRLQYEARELFNLAMDEEWGILNKFIRYYIRKGDKEMIKWVVEQRIGKAPQSMDITSKSLSVNVPLKSKGSSDKIDVMEIAKRVSAELKKIKTQ